MKKLLLSFVFLTTCFFAIAQITPVKAEQDLALSLTRNNAAAIGLSAADLDNSVVTGTYIIPGSDIRMVYLQQTVKGIPVFNRLHVLAFKNGVAVSVAGNRVANADTKINQPSGQPGIDPVNAVRTALREEKSETGEMIVPVNISNEGRRFEFGHLGVSLENISAELLWLPINDDGELKLVWQVFLAPLKGSDYWLIRVDAINNAIVSKQSLTDHCDWSDPNAATKYESTKNSIQKNYVEKRAAVDFDMRKAFVVNTASYRVVKYPAESPQHPGGTPIVVTDPWNMSPGNATTLGWHYDGTSYFDSTRGNNAFAYEDRDANNLPGYAAFTSTAQPSLTFDFTPDFSQEPIVRSPVPNQQFNTTNLFYWNNLMHDLSYLYGFTETARNFQANNLGRGGNGNDYVLAEAQDGSGTNNANFSSPADGSRGRMQMYLWTAPTPDRDGDADNGIIAHEYTHGISNRMTGSGSGCLGNVEQMGEGWSDYLSLMITHNWATAVPGDGFNNPRGIGTYALNQAITGPGIRQYRYTTNMAINPMTYGNLPSVAVPHGVGTIWCTVLWDMTWYIIQQAGINPNLFNPTGTGGNSIALKLVIEGLRLQPCSPGFIDGRNAILKADTLFFGAQYSCAILEAFARRGMGIGASQGSASVRGDETLSFVNGQAIIGTQPQNATVCAGNNHTFTVAATGSNLQYQWQLSTDGGANYNNIAGATSSSLTLTGVTLSMNNYRYRCVVTGCPPAVNSAAAILSVGSSATITTQPVSAAVCESAVVSFTVAATGASVTYQWQLSTDGGANFNNISGATNATLNLGAVTASMDNYRYRCVVNASGCPIPVTSNAVTLTVNTALVVTSQPQNGTVCLGSDQTFSITVTGTSPAYQWQLSTDGGASFNNIPGANASAYTVTGTTLAMNNYRYRVNLSGTCTPALSSNAALLSIVAPASITAQPANKALCAGSNTSFTAGASGATNLQWQVNSGSGFVNVTNGGVYSGATTSTLNLTGAALSMNSYQYRLQVSNAACTTPITSNSATLTVHSMPTISLAADPLLNLLPGKTTTLTATTSANTPGKSSLNLSWTYNGNPLAVSGNSYVVNVEKVGIYGATVTENWTDGSSCSVNSNIVTIGATVSSRLFIFPTPNDGRFTVSYYNNGGASSQRRIIIFSSMGQKVYERQFAIIGPYTLMNIDMRSASRGIYYVVVGDQNGSRLAEGKVHVR